MLLKNLFSYKNIRNLLLFSALVGANVAPQKRDDKKSYKYTIGLRIVTYLSLYNKSDKLIGRTVLTNALYDRRILDQLKDYLNNHEDLINDIDRVEMIGINHAGFMINTDIFEYGVYPLESFKAEKINFDYESGPFHWRQNQVTSSTTEWSFQSYFWGISNSKDDVTYSESDFQKELTDNANYPQVKNFDWKCKYNHETKRCTNFDIISEKSLDLVILGFEKINFPEESLNQIKLFKKEFPLYDPQIVQKFEVENRNFEEAYSWFTNIVVK
ncbi:hypothetical protein PIROE2DRAFT_13666 [Piromyces sp. E2]|nr:hypothetical protein PIROE2DRAFT_13666 [Piromyces sp. E2]|eukprot:OUM60552.1 hypothetical protein PIROE2DRAFT_13666 [Piromyces sp. E2]